MPSLTGQENIQASATGGASSSDLEHLKQEILSEMRKEINAMKMEILAGKKLVVYYCWLVRVR